MPLSKSDAAKLDTDSRRDMIKRVLQMLPENQGTKTEIFAKISETYGISILSEDNAAICKTLTQCLSKYYGKMAPQEYALNVSDVDYSSYPDDYTG